MNIVMDAVEKWFEKAENDRTKEAAELKCSEVNPRSIF